MKKNYVKLISSLILAFCMVVTGVVITINAQAEGESTLKGVKYSETEVPYVEDGNTLSGEGYLFAGWYTKDETGESVVYRPVRTPDSGKAYYVKYVPEEMLGVKAQITTNIVDGKDTDNDITNNSIRFLTSLDSSNYKKIGFRVWINGDEQDTEENVTNEVYEKIYVIGATEASEGNLDPKIKVASEVFGNNASTYFKTYTINEIPEIGFNTDIEVIPYYITYDGTTVYGTHTTRSIDFCCGRFYVSSDAYASDAKNVGTKQSPAKLETAVAIPVDEELVTPTVYIMDDITVQGQASVQSTMTITSYDESNPITIKGTPDATYGAHAFIRVNASGVTISDVIIDGTTMGDESAARAISIGTASPEETPMLIKDTTIQNFKYKGGDSGAGGALWSRGYVVLSNSTLQDCSSVGNGGHIYIHSDTVKISDDSKVSGGSCADGMNGGNVYVNSNAKLILSLGTIDSGSVVGTKAYGSSTYYGVGGNIYCAGTIEMTNGIIRNGIATTKGNFDQAGCGGNIFLTTSGKLSMTGGLISGGKAIKASDYSATGVNNGFGGGNVCSRASEVSISGTAVIKDGISDSRGGNIYMFGASTTDPCTLNIKNATATETLSGGTAVNGGSVFANRCITTIENVTKLSGGTANTGGFMNIWAGSVDLSNTTIDGGTATTAGNVYVGGNASNKSTFTMNAGTTIKNGKTSSGHGGNVYLNQTIFTMNGGTIQNGLAGTNGNTNSSQGGNVYAGDAVATIEINAGSIIDGKAGRRGGNLYLGNQKVTLGSGVITITGGETGSINSTTGTIAKPTVSNVFLFAAGSINSFAIAEDVTLNEESRIGVNSSAGTDVVQYFVTNATQDFEVLKQIFSSDVSSKAIYKDVDKNSLYMTAVTE